MIREMLFSAFVNNPALMAEIGVEGSTDPADLRMYPSGSLGVDPIPAEPATPYAQYALSSSTPYLEVRETGRSLRHLLTVYVYDERGDFTRIDAVHKIVRDTIEGLTGQVGEDGWQCTDALFTTIGSDLTDNVRNLGVKVASYRLVGK